MYCHSLTKLDGAPVKSLGSDEISPITKPQGSKMKAQLFSGTNQTKQPQVSPKIFEDNQQIISAQNRLKAKESIID